MSKLKKFVSLCGGIANYNLVRHFRVLPPTALQINITYKCNSRCQMCQIWKMKPKDELSFREWQEIMKDPIFLTIEHLTVTGGEPILHQELVRLIKLFIDSMPQLQYLTLVTNGFLPKQIISAVRAISKLSQKRGINFSVSVSLDGIGKMHDVIRGTPGAFEKTSSTILGLKKLQKRYRFWLMAGIMICRKNLYQIKKAKQWCQDREIPFNCQLIGFHESYVQNIGTKSELDFWEKDKEHLYSFLRYLAENPAPRDLRAWLKSYYWSDMLALYQGGRRKTPCPFLYDAFVLDSLGDVYYCLSVRKIGNCREDKNVSKIYYDSQNLAFRKQLSKTACRNCNSGCFVTSAIAKDFKKFAWFYFRSIPRVLKTTFKSSKKE